WTHPTQPPIDGTALPSLAEALPVSSGTSGAADPSKSTVTLNPSSVATGGTSTVTLTARDASGTQLTTGGSAVVFSLGTGPASGAFGNVTANHDGTYTATFTARPTAR